jgi:hypothetical protein
MKMREGTTGVLICYFIVTQLPRRLDDPYTSSWFLFSMTALLIKFFFLGCHRRFAMRMYPNSADALMVCTDQTRRGNVIFLGSTEGSTSIDLDDSFPYVDSEDLKFLLLAMAPMAPSVPSGGESHSSGPTFQRASPIRNDHDKLEHSCMRRRGLGPPNRQGYSLHEQARLGVFLTVFTSCPFPGPGR